MKKILPKYTYIPLLCVVVMNFVAFYATRPINSGWQHYNMTIFLDEMIPFVPAMISVYLLCYATWVGGGVIIARESPAVCYEVLTGELIAKLLAMVLFLAVPTTMVRAEITGNDIFSELTRMVYQMDTPDNLFPSVHCLENWIVFRGICKCKSLGRGWRWAALIAAILVFASTVMVKQHVVADILGAMAVVEIGLWLSAKLNAGRLFERINLALKLHPEETK